MDAAAETPIEQQYTPIEVAKLMKRDVKTVQGWLRDPTHPLTGVKIQGQWYISKTTLKKLLSGELR